MIDWCALGELLSQIQPQATDGGNGGGGAGGGGPFGGLNCLLMGLLPLMLVYLMLMNKPQSRESAKTKELLANLKKNDHVVTAGGILGVVVQASPESDNVTIRVDESNNTKLVILKSSIARVLTDSDEDKSES